METAGLGGSAHLISFKGTDTVPAINIIRKYYNSKEIAGYSIPATEHSTVTSWKKSGELKCMDNFLNINPTGTIAFVSDSYDIYNACDKFWGEKLFDKVMNRNLDDNMISKDIYKFLKIEDFENLVEMYLSKSTLFNTTPSA